MEPSTSLHAYLKERTSALHDETDRLFGAIGFDTPARYATFLAVQYAALVEVEEFLAPFAGTLRVSG